MRRMSTQHTPQMRIVLRMRASLLLRRHGRVPRPRQRRRSPAPLAKRSAWCKFNYYLDQRLNFRLSKKLRLFLLIISRPYRGEGAKCVPVQTDRRVAESERTGGFRLFREPFRRALALHGERGRVFARITLCRLNPEKAGLCA